MYIYRRLAHNQAGDEEICAEIIVEYYLYYIYTHHDMKMWILWQSAFALFFALPLSASLFALRASQDMPHREPAIIVGLEQKSPQILMPKFPISNHE